MKTKVVSYKNLPTRSPLLFTAVVYLLLDKFSAAEWIWGVVGVFVVLMWAAFIRGLFVEEPVEIFK